MRAGESLLAECSNFQKLPTYGLDEQRPRAWKRSREMMRGGVSLTAFLPCFSGKFKSSQLIIDLQQNIRISKGFFSPDQSRDI